MTPPSDSIEARDCIREIGLEQSLRIMAATMPPQGGAGDMLRAAADEAHALAERAREAEQGRERDNKWNAERISKLSNHLITAEMALARIEAAALENVERAEAEVRALRENIDTIPDYRVREFVKQQAKERVKAAERERDEQFSGRVQANRRARAAEAQAKTLREALEQIAIGAEFNPASDIAKVARAALARFAELKP